jgi:hypothetical protein
MEQSTTFSPRRNLEQRIRDTSHLIIALQEYYDGRRDPIERSVIVAQHREQVAYFQMLLERYERLCEGMPYEREATTLEYAYLADAVLGAIDEAIDAEYPTRLEARFFMHLEFTGAAAWRQMMAVRERAVCRIEIDGQGVGTGFLVGPDLVMTSYHVIAPAEIRAELRRSMIVRFDHKAPRADAPPDEGRAYYVINSPSWLLAKSAKTRLDYVVLGVEGKPGLERIKGQEPMEIRSWFVPEPRELTVGEPILMLQHPEGRSMKFAIGYLEAQTTEPARLIYRNNTLDGTSGAPCCTARWELVGLHRGGTDRANEGVPFAAILTDLDRQGVRLPPPPENMG